ncbi:MAG: hypothetical protein V1668_00950 [Patescibacteria group bacterium]
MRKSSIIHNNEKNRLEKSALEYFLSFYKKISGEPNKGEKPDYTIKDKKTNSLYGIEIAHLFDGENGAKVSLGKETMYEGTTEDLINIHLNTLLSRKLTEVRNYKKTDKMVLVIRVGDQITEKEDIERLLGLVKLPDNQFDEIWLLIYNWQTEEWSDRIALKTEIKQN